MPDKPDGDGYVQLGPDNVLVGRYNLEIRKYYMAYKIMRFLIDHPGASSKDATKAARMSWRRKALKSMEVARAAR